MSTTTTNFGWTVPSDTDLVKDGAAAIRTALGGVDTSFVDLKGGTSGQVLSKASGTDLDFTWVAQDDSNAIQNAIVDAKGDLIAATAADTPARLAVGTNGQVLTADSAESTGIKWASVASGGMTLINTGGTTLSGTTTTISSIPTTYNDLIIYVNDYTCLFTDYSTLVRFNGDSTASNYQQFVNRGTGSTNNAYVDNSSAGMDLTGYAILAGDNNNSAYIYIPNYASSITKVANAISGFVKNGSAKAVCNNNTYYAGTSPITSISFTTTVGVYSSGTVLVYGVK